MIEAHYAAYIVDAMDAVAGKLMVPLVGPYPEIDAEDCIRAQVA
jgi:hypothetical protein